MASSSVFTQGAIVPNGPVSLSLAKLSHCNTVPDKRAKMTWIHVPERDGVFAVFDTVRQRSIDGSVVEQRVLKIIIKNHQLEQIDLDTLRNQAMLERQYPLYDEDICIIALVKKPLLALRYPLSNGQIRRLQLNFRPESGCDYAVNTLRLFDIPIRFKNDSGAPQTAGGRLARPHSAQAAISSIPQQQSIREPFHRVGGPQSYVSTAVPTHNLAPLPAIASTNRPSPYHRDLPLSGINQDEFSEPLLAHQSRSDWAKTISSTSQHLVPTSVPLTNDSMEETNDTGSEQASNPIGEASNGSWKWIPYKSEQTRPTTAPLTTSARQVLETPTLSQMLPPDRNLPFPEKKDSRPPIYATQGIRESELLLETQKNVDLEPKSTNRVKARKSAKTRKGSTVRESSSTPNRASTPYNLRPGSSSSNVGPSRPVTSDSTLVSEIAKVPGRHRLEGSQSRLSKEGWVLSEAEFLQHFGEEAFQNNAFLEELIRFAKIERDFASAYPLLLNEQKARRSQTPLGHKVREWMSNDVKKAIEGHKKAASDKKRKQLNTVVANTPRKRLKATSPGPMARVLERQSRESTHDSTEDETETPTLPALQGGSGPKKSSTATRKRHTATFEIDSANPETKPAKTTEPAHRPTSLKPKPTSALPTATQLQPATPAELPPPLTPEQQTTALSTPPAPPNPHPPDPPPAPNPPPSTTTTPPATTANATANPTATPDPASLLHLLNTWATTSPLFRPPPTLPQSSKDLLAHFAAQSVEGRAVALDEMICECLEDENFTLLAKELEGAWMRVGLEF